MDRDQAFFETFLQAAHPTRFGTELVSMPRQKSSLFQVNTEDEIDAGYALSWMGQRKPLTRLNGYGWSNGKKTGTPFNALRNSIQRQEDSKVAKKWFFTTYPDNSSVSFLQFDLDRHHESGMIPWEKDEIDHDFKMQVTAIREMADEVGCDVVWTTSPGDLIDAAWNVKGYWESGAHVQGLYAWIKLEKPVQVKKLRKYVKALKEYYGIECESSVNSPNRLIRLPGQRYVEVADPETLQILHPAQKPADTLTWFAEAWHTTKPAKLKDLFGPAWAWRNKENVSVVPPQISPSLNIKHVHVDGCTADEALKEKNTFKAATAHRICSSIAIKYQGQECYFDQAVEEAKIQLSGIRPSSSKTCRNPHLLHATCKRWMKWYFTSFDSSQCSCFKRDKEDQKRFSSSGSIDQSFLLRFLKKHVSLSFHELSIVSSIFDKMKSWRGRVYCKVLYSLAGGKQKWLELKKKLQSYLVVLDEWELKKCRQWGWSQEVLAGVLSMQQASANAAVLIADAEDKKCVMVGASPKSMNLPPCDPTDQHILPISTVSKENDYQTNDFLEQ